MRLHRFFIEDHLRNKKDLTLYDKELIHQLKDVFRFRTGDKIILLDNSGFEYLSEIVVLAKGKLEIKIIQQDANLNSPKREVWLFVSLIKKDKFEWILEKGTELGVSHFVPILSERSEKKDLHRERAEKIIKEASEQSGRGTLPVLHELIQLKEIFSNQEKFPPLITFHPGGEKFDVMKTNSPSNTLGTIKTPVGVLIGPEGGWSEKEILLLKEKNIPICSLGSQVLRAETAAIAVSSLLLL